MRYLSKLLKAEEIAVLSPLMIGENDPPPPTGEEVAGRLALEAAETLIEKAVKQAEELRLSARTDAIRVFIREKGDALTAGYEKGLSQGREAGSGELRRQEETESGWLAERTAELEAHLARTRESLYREALDFAFGLAGIILGSEPDRHAARFGRLTGEMQPAEPEEPVEAEAPPRVEEEKEEAALPPAGNLTVHMDGGTLRVEGPEAVPVCFDDILEMDDEELRQLTANCELRDIMVILRSSDEAAAARIQSVLPERIRDTASEELVFMGPVGRTELENARARILRVLLRMRQPVRPGRQNGGEEYE